MSRYVHPAVQAYRDSGKPMVQRHLVWITARDYSTGGPVAAGWWDGRYDMEIPVYDPATTATVSRTYHAAGSLLSIETVGHYSGLDVNPVRVELNPINDAVDQHLRGYDLRGAAVEMHRVWYDYETRAQIAPGHVWKVGTINKAPKTTPAAGGAARLSLTVVPITRSLTIGNPEILSDEIQRQRGGDRILRYLAMAGIREIPWMRK